MSFITGKHMARRTFLRGMGVTAALPFLDAMVPAGRLWARTRDAGRTRLVCIEEVHGLAGCNEWGAQQGLYAPAQVGTNFELVPDNPLTSLLPYRDYLTIVSNTDVRMAEAFSLPEIGGDHFRSTAVFLTQAKPKQTQGSDVYAAPRWTRSTRSGSARTRRCRRCSSASRTLDQAGGCTYNYSCVYTDSVSWASPTEPLPMIRDPRVAFDMLFGAGTTPEDRAARRKSRPQHPRLDPGRGRRLRKDLGAADRLRLDRYLENVREIERRIQMVEAHNTSGEHRELPEAPIGVPDSFTEHMKLMFDLQVLAFATDMTRVTSRSRPAATRRTACSRRADRASRSTRRRTTGTARTGSSSSTRSTSTASASSLLPREAEGDDGRRAEPARQDVVIWGSPMADANVHNHRRCPLMLLGKGDGIG
jgi:hypothetical protein